MTGLFFAWTFAQRTGTGSARLQRPVRRATGPRCGGVAGLVGNSRPVLPDVQTRLCAASDACTKSRSLSGVY